MNETTTFGIGPVLNLLLVPTLPMMRCETSKTEVPARSRTRRPKRSMRSQDPMLASIRSAHITSVRMNASDSLTPERVKKYVVCPW